MLTHRRIRSPIQCRYQRGAAAMITVLFLLVVVGFAVLVSLDMSGSDVSDSTSQHNSIQALFLAESGIERAGYNYGNSATCTNAGIGAGVTVYSLGNGGFTLDSAAPDAVNPALCRVRVTGRVGQVARTVDGWFSGGGTIAVEAWNSNSGSTSGRTMSVALTVGGTGRVLVVGISVDSANSDVTSVTYAGQALTYRGGSGTGNGRPSAEIWTLTNPPTGVSTVIVTLSANDQIAIGAVSFTGVNLTTPLDVPIFGTSGNNGTSATAALTTVTNNAWVVDVLALNNGVTPTMTVLAGRTSRWNRPVGTSITGAGSTYGPKTPAGAVSLQWTWAGSRRWAIEAIALRPGGSPVLTRWSEVVQ